MTVLVKSPEKTRCIVIRPKKRSGKKQSYKEGLVEGDERLELHLQAGDAYCMNGT